MNAHRSIPRLAMLALSLSVAGCAPYLGSAKAREVDKTVPESYGESHETKNSARLTVDEFFADPNLVSLVEQALANNQELNIVQLEISIAKNEIMARKGEYLPKVDVGGVAGIDKVGKYTSRGASDEANNLPENLEYYGVGFTASWEIDIWRKLRNATKAAYYRYLSTVEGKNFVVTRLVAELARSYYELMALDNQLDVLNRNIEIQNAALQIVRIQKQAAKATELAVQRFEAEVLKNRARLFEVQQRIVETENRVNLLVGRFPQPITRNSKEFLEIIPVAVDEGIPAQLLENRPDLRKAEMDLEAAKLDVSVAKARFYPSLSLDGWAGVESFDVSHISFFPESLFYGLIANVSAPLINRLALTAGYFVSNSRQMQAVYNFERTIRKAYAEVANQRAMISNFGQKYELKAREVDVLRNAIDVSNKLFASARADYMEVLLTRRDALNSQLELIETKKRQLDAMVNIYQALGGGWRQGDEKEQSDSGSEQPDL